MATHSSTLAWKIQWTEKPGRLQSMGSLRVGHYWATSLTFHFHALEKEMATHSSILAWRIPGTEESSELPSMGSHRFGHDWCDLAVAAGQNRKILCWSPTPKTSYCSALRHYQGLWESLELILSWCLQKRHALPMPWTQISSLHNCCLVAQLYLILCDHMDCNP